MAIELPSASAAGGRYELLRRLAVGGMGEIFLARERGRRGFSRLVVIKKMLPELAAQPGYVDMFVDEARIIGHLGHPNICQIHELGDDHGLPFLALEYVRGENLTGLYNRAHQAGVPVPRRFALRVIADVAWALDFAHDAHDPDGRALNIVHRDISPHNVMVSFRGDVKLMDFGIARADNRSHRTDADRIKGKLAYMAPEQVANRPLDRRVDVFALGVMLWELTLGRRLFAAATEVETFRNALACRVPPPRTIDPAYPPGLEAIVLQALTADRDRRTATAGALARALTEHLAAEGAVDRTELAAVMGRVFPDAVAAADDEVVTASWLTARELELDGAPPPAGEPGTVTATAPGGPSPGSEPATVAIGRPARPAAGALATAPPARRRRALPAIAGGAALTGALAVALAWPRGAARPPGATAAVSVDAALDGPAPHRAAPPPRRRAGRADAADADADAAADAGAATPAAHRRAADREPGPARPRHVDRPPPAPTPTVATPSPPPVAAPTPTRGSLAVSSTPTGLVRIDGVPHQTTPFQIELAAGDHAVEVELVEGAGTFRATAHVEPGEEDQMPRRQPSAVVCAAAVAAVIALAAPVAADPAAQLADVRQRFDELDYELVLAAADEVVAAPDATAAQRAEALFLRGAALVVLDRGPEAGAAFDGLLAIEPSFRAPPETPPRIRAAFESARAAWRVRLEEDLATRLGAQLRHVQRTVAPPPSARGGRPLTLRVRLTDPDHLATRVVLGYRRESERDYSIVSAPAGPDLALTVPGAVLAAAAPYRLAWYVHAIHASGAVLRRAGDDDQPAWQLVSAGRVPRPPPLTRRWWFWTGAVALAASAVVVPIVVIRGRDVGPQQIVVGP